MPRQSVNNLKSEARSFAMLPWIALVLITWSAWCFFAPSFVKKVAPIRQSVAGNQAEPAFQDAGQFGDMFGALNALFTGIAFVGLVYTIRIQQRQLRIAENELHETKLHAEHQQFDSTFFQLLGVFNSIIDGIESSKRVGALQDGQHMSITGRSVLKSHAESFTVTLRAQGKSVASEGRPGFITEKYNEFYHRNDERLAHYFRTLYRLLRWVDAAGISNKVFYAKIIRAQLSSQELVLLFHNSFIDEGKKMRNFILRYALLKHLPADCLAVPQDKNLYDDAAYDDDKAAAYRESQQHQSDPSDGSRGAGG